MASRVASGARKGSIRAALSVAVTLVLVACGTSGGGGAKQIIIGYGAPELTGGQPDIQRSLVKHAEALGWKVATTNANADAQKQNDQIDSFIAQGVNAIVVVPVDSAAVCAGVKKAQQAHIPFYTIDRAPIGCKINMTVLSDNYLAGKQAGQATLDLLKKKFGEPKGTVLELQGDLATNVAQLRGGGFDDVMKQYPNIKLIQKPTKWDESAFGSNTRDVISTQTVDAIYMHSDGVGTSPVTQALQQLGKLKTRDDPAHIIISGVDGSAQGLDAIRKGYEDALGAQPIPDFGVIVNYIKTELEGKQIHKQTVTQEGTLWSPAQVKSSDTGWQLFLSTTLVTPQNVDDKRLWGNQPSS